MDVHSIDEIAGSLPLLTVGPGTTQADFMTAMRPLGVANGCVASLLRYTGQVPGRAGFRAEGRDPPDPAA